MVDILTSGKPFENTNLISKYVANKNPSEERPYNYERIRIPNCSLLPHQKVAWNAKERLAENFKDEIKLIILEWSRRQGKDIFSLQCIVDEAFNYPSNNYYVFPEKRQAKEAIFEAIDADGRALIDYIPKALIHKIDKVSMTIYLYTKVHGAISTIQFKGSDADKMVGTSLRCVVFSEYALCTPNVWYYLEPSIAMNKGFAIFVSTPRGFNHFTDLIDKNKDKPNCFYSFLNITMTVGFNNKPIFTEEDVQKKIDAGMPFEKAQQEYYCSRQASLVGAYYKNECRKLEESNRFVPFEPDKYEQWYCSIDIGIRDLMVLWFGYKKGNYFYLYHSYGNNYKDIRHYSMYIQKVKHSLGLVNPIKLLLPHDATKKDIVNGTSPALAFERYGHECYLIKRSSNKLNDITYIRDRFQYVIIHNEKAFVGFNHLKQYTKRYNKVTGMYVEEELHNEASNFADSFRYFILGLDGLGKGRTSVFSPSGIR